MRIKDADLVSEPGYTPYRKDGVQIDRAEDIRLYEQESEQELQIVDQIEQGALLPGTADTDLPKWLSLQGWGITPLTPDQGDIKSRFAQGATDPDHTLIMAEIVGNGKDDVLHEGALKSPR